MGFKMKGSSFYGKTIKQSGRVPSPFKQTGDDKFTSYGKYEEGGGDVDKAKKWNTETYGTENPTAEAKRLNITKVELAKRHKASKSKKSDNNNETSIKDGGSYSGLSLNPRFKKPIANSIRNSDTDKNAIKSRDEFAKEGVELRKTTKLTGDEKEQVKKFEDLLKKTDLKNTQFRDDLTLDEGETFEYDGRTYQAGDIIIIKQNTVVNNTK